MFRRKRMRLPMLGPAVTSQIQGDVDELRQNIDSDLPDEAGSLPAEDKASVEDPS